MMKAIAENLFGFFLVLERKIVKNGVFLFNLNQIEQLSGTVNRNLEEPKLSTLKVTRMKKGLLSAKRRVESAITN